MNGRLFGRACGARGAAIAASASRFLACSSPEDRAAARNAICDDRVSDTRAADFFDWLYSAGFHDDLRKGLGEYFYERVRKQEQPAFEHAMNRNNFIAGSPPESLAHVLDLTALTSVLRFGRRRGIPGLSALPGPAPVTDADIRRFLQERLDGANVSDRELTIAGILEALNLITREEPYEPCWGGAWDHFERHAGTDPESWLEAVGAPRHDYPRWIIVLRYPTSEIARLVRPSQLDAGWFAYHFPTPCAAPADAGGLAMSLRDGAGPGSPPVPEFIHRRIPLHIDHWRAAGYRFGRTTRPVGTGLQAYRDRHYRHLIERYGEPLIRNWMPG